ncbi:class I SAM-dependent methyltransferase [Paenibacillus cymbidii]|uniref:class I SAM-dependent methyltransferase n=1 Tax=Paenibacillus cymbidii TaxID=1639034 RepID=UPI00107FE7CF|nr:SAM-dependent methyltransferase [Paenibacillus cymbidii]
MEHAQALIRETVEKQTLLAATLSNPRRKGPDEPSKIKLKPLMLKGGPAYQFALTVGTKELHENHEPEAAAARLIALLTDSFKQGLLQTKDADYQILVNKHGQAAIKRQPATKAAPQPEALAHNRKKMYILEEGEPAPFLVELGVMNAQGKVLAAKYDKFRQINRFLELIADVVPHLATGRRLRIIDFGCGKSYLTFALYHYLAHVLRLDIEVTGLDLKADVIAHCSALADKLGYERLRFAVGDIGAYEGADRVDMVVTLHACDTATDAALDKAVRWGADVILSVPCCQHELFAQVDSALLAPMLGHGIVKERFAALLTDSVRASLLELVGYKTQIVEFIDMEHTAKNLLIRAVRQPHPDAAKRRETARAYNELKRQLRISPYLERALADRLAPLPGEDGEPSPQ